VGDPSQVDNILIENTTLGPITNGYLGLSIGSSSHDCGHTRILVQNNTFYAGADAQVSCGFRPTVVFRNNIVLGQEACLNWGFNEEWTYDYNVFANPGPGCRETRHARVCTPVFLDRSHANGYADVAPGDRCAREAGDPSAYPLNDMRGKPRWAPDAGAAAVTQQPSKTKLLARRTAATSCELEGLLPDRACSPGAIYTDATAQIICAPLYASRAFDMRRSAMAAVYHQYGIPRQQRGLYEIDHVVPLELGGSNDPANLFPQLRPQKRAKNALDRRLQRLVCDSQRSLRLTQRAIARNWVAVYRQVFGRGPG
jgi:hypothetical protein